MKKLYIGVIEDNESHRPARLFAKDRIAIILSMDYKKVVTVYRADNVTYEPFKNKVLELHRKKFHHYEITEHAKQKRLDKFKLEAKVEIAQCELRKYKSKSIAVKNACEARIYAINQILDERINEIQQIQNEKRRIARSMISVV